MNITEFHANVRQWAAEKGLLPDHPNTARQFLKFVEEWGETVSAIEENDKMRQVDGIGDCLVVLCAMSSQLRLPFTDIYHDSAKLPITANPTSMDVSLGLLAEAIAKNSDRKITKLRLIAVTRQVMFIAYAHDISLSDAMEIAWHTISKRTGTTVDGVFIKDTP